MCVCIGDQRVLLECRFSRLTRVVQRPCWSAPISHGILLAGVDTHGRKATHRDNSSLSFTAFNRFLSTMNGLVADTLSTRLLKQQ